MRTLRLTVMGFGGAALCAGALVACSGDDSNSGTPPDGGTVQPDGSSTGDARNNADGTLPDGALPDASSDGTMPDAASIDGGSDAGLVGDAGDASLDGTLPEAAAADGGADASDAGTGSLSRVVYVESNDTAANKNGVFAFAQGPDGSLTPVPGSPFPTAGMGVGNPTQGLGPDDSDQEILLSADGLHLFAVNAGSNTIAVFDVHADGSLTPIAGSPFSSGGINPVSVGIAGSFLYVVNQDQDPAQNADAGSPGYFTLPLAANGSLAAATSMAVAGKSPQVALTTPNGKLLFGVDFMAPLANAQGPLRAFAIGADGTLTAAPGTPLALPVVDGGSPPGTPLALGLAVHPTQSILYVGFVLRKEIGVYTYDAASGALTYVTSAPLSGPAPCWVRANATGSRIYTTTTGDNGVSVLDTSLPLAPTEKEHLILNDEGPFYDAGGSGSPTSQSYEENLSPDGKYLFVLSQRTTLDSTVTTGNVLHVLRVAGDGTVSETVADVPLDVAVGVRPQGVAIR
jgi:DNA-binding beta-propeller fold protein YncE